jgi:tyrosyl-tRNA synthetase
MKINANPQNIKETLERGVEEIVDKNHLEEQMSSGKQLRVKFGIDPTAPDIHLGHAVGLRKLRQFQNLGHKAVLIVGDFTTLIGDPSGRTTSRPPLSEAQIRDNMKDYISQASKVIDVEKAEIHHNSEWFKKEPMSFLMGLASRFTVARLIEREDFQKRLKEGSDVSMLELLYPMLQAYDSVACRADIEIGGYDQRLNFLFTRRAQKKFGQSEQDILMVPLLIGIDGSKKMSKSVGNYIRLDEEGNKMFTQLMAVPDSQMWNYFELLTDRPKEEIENLKKEILENKKHPRDVKMEMALEIVSMYRGAEASKSAKEEFVSVTQRGELPSDISSVETGEKEINILDLLVKAGAAASKSEAKRLVVQNGVRLDGEVKNDWKETLKTKKGQIVQVGKSRFFKLN